MNEIDYTGSCHFFNPRPFVEAANMLCAADEPLRALGVLDSMPGFYRDNMPVEVYDLRKRIRKHLATPTFYIGEKASPRYTEPGHDVPTTFSTYVTALLRGQLVLKDVQDANAQGVTPKIVDLGPGEYWMPIGMKHLGAKLDYRGVGLNDANEIAAKPYMEGISKDFLPEEADIFVACEIIEHLHHEQDIRTEFERHAPNAKIVHISTPLYTYDGSVNAQDWEAKGGLGHLRTYTPSELIRTIQAMFPEFKWTHYRSQIQHMRGERA